LANRNFYSHREFCEKLEVLLHETPQPAQQEPVAWRVRFHYGTGGMAKRIGDWKLYHYSPTPEKDKEVEPLHTSPPAQRTWIGLEKKDKNEIIRMTERDDRGYVMALVEAKLKEKNT